MTKILHAVHRDVTAAQPLHQIDMHHTEFSPVMDHPSEILNIQNGSVQQKNHLAAKLAAGLCLLSAVSPLLSLPAPSVRSADRSSVSGGYDEQRVYFS